MREPKTMEQYLELIESAADQWIENTLCAETVEEVISINWWYMNSIHTIVSMYFEQVISSFPDDV